MFLMWLNTSWWTFLFGAQVAYSAANLRRLTLTLEDRCDLVSSWDLLAAVVAVARENADSHGPVSGDLVAEALGLPGEGTDALLERLTLAGLLARTAGADEDDPHYLPALPAEQLRAIDVLRFDCAYTGKSGRSVAPTVRSAVGSVLSRMEAGIENLTVADIIHA